MNKKFFLLLISIVIFITGCGKSDYEGRLVEENWDTLQIDLEAADYDEIYAQIEKLMEKTNVPGISMVIVSAEQTRYISFGYADRENMIIADENTLYEIGSMSKAFTGLAILLLEEEGKLSLDDDIQDYLPWLELKYKGIYQGKQINEPVKVTIKNFLYHTSGIPYESIVGITPSSDDMALENTVRTLAGSYLKEYPGEVYNYATINYDVLGLVIEEVSGMTYEEYVEKNILIPLGLFDTYVDREKAEKTGRLAKGYKTKFFFPRLTESPEFRGNVPAGYYISSAADMERWIRIQLGLTEVPEIYQRIIERSHISDTTVRPSYNDFYGAGWQIELQAKEYMHSGINPNFASMIYMEPLRSYGICVLSNLSANTAGYINSNTTDLLKGKKIEMMKYRDSFFQSYDAVFSLASIIGILLIIFYLIAMIRVIGDIKSGRRCKNKQFHVGQLIIGIFMYMYAMICIYYLPHIMFSRITWKAVLIWGTEVIVLGTIAIFLGFSLFYLHFMISLAYPAKKEKNYISLAILSIINGASGAFIIFTINETFNRELDYSKELFLYFCFALLFYCYTYKLLQTQLILISNGIIYEYRMKLINRILGSSYRTIELIGQEKIYTGLNNDTNVISRLPNIILNLSSNVIIIFFCLTFLFYKNIAAFLVSIVTILINMGLVFLVSRSAEGFFDKCRHLQDIYFRQLYDLIYGFKELALSKVKRREFINDIYEKSKLSKSLSIKTDIKYMNLNLFNNVLHNLIFGTVVFVLPIFIINMDVNDLRETLFMVFYMIAPFSILMGTFPDMTEIRINFRRLNELYNSLDKEIEENKQLSEPDMSKHIKIEYRNLKFSYEDLEGKDKECFSVQDISLDISLGQIVFITGGNGSGKSTVGKLLTGIYKKNEGTIKINNEICTENELKQYYSAVYSDFHIFYKMYGFNPEEKKEFFEMLDIMGIKEKVIIGENGEFDFTGLSTGQKKRLAFALCCMDKKPFLLLDEWAAEQDPAFKEFFYTSIIPMLKAKGKGIIMITHDDSYYNVADKVIKLEFGRIV